MLEARLISKLAYALALWETPPYYTNDAQYRIQEAVNLAADSLWESRIAEVLEPEFPFPTYEQIVARTKELHPDIPEDKLIGSTDLIEACQEADRQRDRHIVQGLENLINDLCSAIGDKIHRRNLQITDLKRQLETAGRKLARLEQKEKEAYHPNRPSL